MKKKILILMAENTGSGHKSAAKALGESFSAKSQDFEIITYDGMKLLGKRFNKISDNYVNMTLKTPLLWKISFEIMEIFSFATNYLIYKSAHKKIKKLIEDTKPDLVLSLHPMMLTPVAKVLKKMKSDIPFYVQIIDLVRISKMWLYKKSDMTFCPTEKIYLDLLKKGFKKEKLFVTGFPVRHEFKLNKNKKIDSETLNILMVNSSTKKKKVYKFAKILHDNFNVKLKIVTGLDTDLKIYLDEKFKGENNIEIFGYVNDMPEKFSNADVILTKAGPNILLEAVRTATPIVVTGHIPGQECRNYQYITKNSYGIKCESPKKIKKTFLTLIENNYEMLKKFSANEINCKETDGADTAADFIINKFKN